MSFASCRLDSLSRFCLRCRVDSWLDACPADPLLHDRPVNPWLDDGGCPSAHAAADLLPNWPTIRPPQRRHCDKASPRTFAMPATPPSTSPSKRRRVPSHDASAAFAAPADDPTPRPLRRPPSEAGTAASPAPSLSYRQAVSVYTQSSGSGLSPQPRRSVSPVKKTIDLRKLESDVTCTPLSNLRVQLPPSMLRLHHSIVGVTVQGAAFVPVEIKPRIQQILQDIGELEWPAGWFRGPKAAAADALAAAEAELEAVRDISSQATQCLAEGASEAAWNLEVHAPLLKLATGPGVSRHLATTVRIEPRWIPRTRQAATSESASSSSTAAGRSRSAGVKSGSGATAGKMVDFVLALNTAGTALGAAMTSQLRANTSPEDISINQTTYGPLAMRPIGVSIETNVASGNAEEGRLQLALWTLSWFLRLEAWLAACPDQTVAMLEAVPVILVVEHSWRLCFFCRRADSSYELLYDILIGETKDILGVYRILSALRILAKWVDTEFRAWMEGVLHIPGTETQ